MNCNNKKRWKQQWASYKKLGKVLCENRTCGGREYKGNLSAFTFCCEPKSGLKIKPIKK